MLEPLIEVDTYGQQITLRSFSSNVSYLVLESVRRQLEKRYCGLPFSRDTPTTIELDAKSTIYAMEQRREIRVEYGFGYSQRYVPSGILPLLHFKDYYRQFFAHGKL